MGIISNGTTILDAGAIDSGVATGKMTLIKTLTASNSATLSFVHGSDSVVFDSTYDSYVFKIINIHPETASYFQVNFRDGGSSYDASKTSSSIKAQHRENGTNGNLEYRPAEDLVDSTSPQVLTLDIGTENDGCGSGELKFFDPSDTTFVKHFWSKMSYLYGTNYSMVSYVQGYCTATTAIDGVQFSMVSDNIMTGQIKLYGIGG
tara:strand:+ start:568 stop:1182 length:615 start_codon:yes stop_codon:yes gene_type:complete